MIIAAHGKGFSAGHDFKELMSLSDSQNAQKVFEQCANLMVTLLRLHQPVIAQIQGIATAAGCQLVATCDLALAGQSARFATSGINFGLFCATPMVALTRTVMSPKASMEMLITGSFMSAQQVWEIGLINRVVPDEELVQATQQLAQSIANKPAELIFTAKKTFYQQLSDPIEQAYDYCCTVMTKNFMSDVAQEGITAFLQKRKPIWYQKPI